MVFPEGFRPGIIQRINEQDLEEWLRFKGEKSDGKVKPPYPEVPEGLEIPTQPAPPVEGQG